MLPATSMGARLIINPVSGRHAGRRLALRLRRLLRDGFGACRASFSRGPGEIAAQAEAAALAGHDPVIIAGGDGSLHEAVNGLMRAGTDTRLGVIPIGSGNDFAKVAGIPLDWQAACARIATGTTHRIDVGRCNDRYFVNGVGGGFDAQIALAAKRIPLLRGRWIYAVALARVWLGGVPAPRIVLEDEHGRIEQRITLVAVANGQFYGGAFHIAPQARLDDGLLEVVLADPVGRLGVLRFAPRVLRGTHLHLPIITYRRSTRITIRCAAGMAAHADGELLDAHATHLEIDLLPARLALIV